MIMIILNNNDNLGVESMLHMTCLGSSKDEITKYLQKAKNLGLRNILGIITLIKCIEYKPIFFITCCQKRVLMKLRKQTL